MTCSMPFRTILAAFYGAAKLTIPTHLLSPVFIIPKKEPYCKDSFFLFLFILTFTKSIMHTMHTIASITRYKIGDISDTKNISTKLLCFASVRTLKVCVLIIIQAKKIIKCSAFIFLSPFCKSLFYNRSFWGFTYFWQVQLYLLYQYMKENQISRARTGKIYNKNIGGFLWMKPQKLTISLVLILL